MAYEKGNFFCRNLQDIHYFYLKRVCHGKWSKAWKDQENLDRNNVKSLKFINFKYTYHSKINEGVKLKLYKDNFIKKSPYLYIYIRREKKRRVVQ